MNTQKQGIDTEGEEGERRKAQRPTPPSGATLTGDERATDGCATKKRDSELGTHRGREVESKAHTYDSTTLIRTYHYCVGATQQTEQTDITHQHIKTKSYTNKE